MVPWYVSLPISIVLLMLVFRGYIVAMMFGSKKFAFGMVVFSWVLMLIIAFGDRL